MKKIFTLLFLICTMGSFAQVRISQVYGGGGNSAATYTNDFIELFNAGSSAVDITGWSVQYASATGTSWAVTTLSGSISPGKYYLIGLGGGSTGVPLPTTDATGSFNMSGTTGKVALVNDNTALSGTNGCTASSVVDALGYGGGSCFEAAVFTPTGISNSKSMFRKSNGCTETNNNSSDFEVLDVAPRNSSSPANPCGAPSPILSAYPTVTGLQVTLGSPSAESAYTLDGTLLTPASGNITVTPGTDLEISTTTGGPYTTSPILVPYTGGTLSTTLYVRIAATAPVGAFSSSVVHTGGGAAAAPLNVNGTVSAAYYNTKANLGLTNLGTWSSTLDGTGPSPANFTDAYQSFNIVNQANANYSGVLGITPSSSKLVIGDGINPITFTVLPGVDSVTSATRIDVLNNGTLVLQNERRPFLNNLATGSTVDFAQSGTTTSDTIRIPAISFYNLKLTGGLKYFSGGVTTTRGDFTANGVVSMNGNSPSFSTLNALGNVVFSGGSAFEPSPSGDAARLTLKMNGDGPSKNLFGNGTDIKIFRLQRDSSEVCTIETGTNTTLTLGNATSGGLQLSQANTLLNLAGNTLNVVGGGYVTNAALGKIYAEGANISIARQTGSGNAGVLRFEIDAYLNNFTINLGPSIASDTLLINDDITVNGVASFSNGKVVMASGKTFSMDAGSSVSGGSASSLLDGNMAKYGNTNFTFPVGKGDKYAPVDIAALSGNSNYSVEYFFSGYGNATIDPATAALYPQYNVSPTEYWVINRTNSATANLTLHYTDSRSNIFVPSGIRIAHFDGSDWDDLGGTPNVANTTSSGSVTVNNVSQYSPFTFGAIANNVLPVTLTAFNVQKQNSAVKISWATEQEVNTREFRVERSVNGRDWTVIRTLQAAGNSSNRLHYAILDENPVKGINYYRIAMVDNDQKVSLTGVKTILFNSAYSIMINPNPASDYINLYIAGNSNQPYQVTVTDMSGKKMMELQSTESILKIPATKLSAGVYILRVKDQDNVVTQKVIVQ